MWQRFTERARRVILLAQEEAGKMSAGHVGTEHLLLGLLREDEGVAAQVLNKMGVEFASVRPKVQAEAEHPAGAPIPEPRLTPEAKRILELAADEARRMRHNYIGTEHLLLGLLREKDGLAARILRGLGLELEAVRAQVLSYLGPDDRSGESAADPDALSGTLAALRRTVFGEKKPGSAPRDKEEQRKLNDRTLAAMLDAWLEGEGAPINILVECGLDVEAARRKLKQFLEESTE